MLERLRKFFGSKPVESALNYTSLCLLQNGKVIAILQPNSNPKGMKVGGWFVGDFGCGQDGHFVWLGMGTGLVRDGKLFSVGFDGCEEHVGTLVRPLKEGDEFVYRHVWDYCPPESHELVKVIGSTIS